MARRVLTGIAALACVLATAGCIHLGTQQRGPSPGRADFSVVPPPPAPQPPGPAPVRVRPRTGPDALPYRLWHRYFRGRLAYVVRVSLPDVHAELLFASDRAHPHRAFERFDALRRRAGSAIVASGAFFGERSHRTMGTLISAGQVWQGEPTDDLGTALEIDARGVAVLRTLRLQAARRDCPFFFQAGPRLVRDGSIWLHPRFEGFKDPVLLDRARRVAAGIAHGGRVLLLVGFPQPISLPTEAEAMRDLGCRDAMNLDGGSSAALAIGNRVLVRPDTPLTHLVVFRPDA